MAAGELALAQGLWTDWKNLVLPMVGGVVTRDLLRIGRDRSSFAPLVNVHKLPYPFMPCASDHPPNSKGFSSG